MSGGLLSPSRWLCDSVARVTGVTDSDGRIKGATGSRGGLEDSPTMTDETSRIILAALVRLEAGQAELRAEMTDLRAGMASLREDVTAQVAALTARVERLEVGQAAIHHEMVTRDDLALMRRDLATREDLTALRVAVIERIDRLQDQITAIRDDISVNIGAADTVRRANDNTRADLRTLNEQVNIMWRQIKTLEARVRDITGDP